MLLLLFFFGKRNEVIRHVFGIVYDGNLVLGQFRSFLGVHNTADNDMLMIMRAEGESTQFSDAVNSGKEKYHLSFLDRSIYMLLNGI